MHVSDVDCARHSRGCRDRGLLSSSNHMSMVPQLSSACFHGLSNAGSSTGSLCILLKVLPHITLPVCCGVIAQKLASDNELYSIHPNDLDSSNTP